MIRNFIIAVALVCTAFFYAQAQQFKALLYTETAGWHHESIHEGVEAIRWLGERHDFEVYWTENSGLVFNDEKLAKYDLVIFLNTSENVLNEEEQAAFERFIQSGKGFVGIHSASDTEYDWPWFNQLVGRMFYIHPHRQTALLKVENKNFIGLERWPEARWWTDEWYEFTKEESDNLNYLITVDESTYDIRAHWQANPHREERLAKGHGDFHPIAWYHEHDGGRAFYTALGHIPETYSDELFREHIYGGIFWAATGRGVLSAKKGAK